MRNRDVALFRGKHYVDWIPQVREFEKLGRTGEAEALLLSLIDVIENESRVNNHGVAPWYYERLAMIYHKQRRTEHEIKILERFARQRHAPGVTPPRLMERLANLKRKSASRR